MIAVPPGGPSHIGNREFILPINQRGRASKVLLTWKACFHPWLYAMENVVPFRVLVVALLLI